ncbi:hypothetical protein ACLKA6_013607 [Drosophila palustris]
MLAEIAVAANKGSKHGHQASEEAEKGNIGSGFVSWMWITTRSDMDIAVEFTNDLVEGLNHIFAGVVGWSVCFYSFVAKQTPQA